MCALGVWSTNSPSGNSNSCCCSSSSVSELVRGVLEVEEVPKAGFLPLWRFAVSGGVLCILNGCGRAVLVAGGVLKRSALVLDGVLFNEKIFGSSLATATFLAVGDGEDAAPGTWGL